MVEKRTKTEQNEVMPSPPVLARRRKHRNSTFKLGRTIGAEREKLETANERHAAYKKNKRKKLTRLFMTIGVFAIMATLLFWLFISFTKDDGSEIIIDEPELLSPTIEIIDEDLGSSNLTSRMKLFIARVEKEFKSLGFKPIKAVLPKGSIREIDFYLEEVPGFVKTIVDRDPAVTVEDADRMFRYLSENGISEYIYIDVRIDGKAYWK